MDYGAVLSRAWHITWRYKALWILGILAGCSGSGGGGGGGRGSTSFSNFGGNGQGNGPEFFNNIPEETWIIIALGLLCLVLLLIVLFVVLGAIGKGGLIAGFNLVDEGETVGLRQAFNLSLTYFWRVLAIQILVGAAWFLTILVFAILALGAVLVTLGLALICILPIICLLIPLAAAVNVFATLAQNAVIVEDQGVVEALGSAWETVKAHVGPVVVMTLILLVGGFIVGLLIGLPVLALLAPVIAGLLIGSQTSITSGLAIFGLCLVVYIPVAILLNGVLQTYINGSWTLTYRRLTDRSGVETLPEPAA
jgi:hypothetical protein